jgi:hypothetical protein
MRITPVLLTASLAVLALAACKKTETTNAPASGAPAAATTSPAAPASTFPQRQAGLWRMAISDGQQVNQTTEMCIDAATDKELSVMGQSMPKQACTDETMSRGLDGSWSFSSVCNMGTGGKTTTHGSASGDFSSHYVVRFDTMTEGAAVPQMNGKHAFTIDSTRTGPCPAGQVGGDVTIHGMKINVLKQMKAR